MPWSAVAPDHHPRDAVVDRKVYDVVVPRGPRTAEATARRQEPGYAWNVLLQRTTGLPAGRS